MKTRIAGAKSSLALNFIATVICFLSLLISNSSAQCRTISSDTIYSGIFTYLPHSDYAVSFPKILLAGVSIQDATLDEVHKVLYYIEGDTVYRAQAEPGSAISIFVKGIPNNPNSVAYDPWRDRVYVSTASEIWMYSKNGSKVHKIATFDSSVDGGRATKLWFRVADDKLYWKYQPFNYAGSYPTKIFRSRPDGMNPETVAVIEFGYDLVVDITHDRIYSHDLVTQHIYTSKLDGSQKHLAISDGGYKGSFAVDESAGDLYYYDYEIKGIMRLANGASKAIMFRSRDLSATKLSIGIWDDKKVLFVVSQPGLTKEELDIDDSSVIVGVPSDPFGIVINQDIIYFVDTKAGSIFSVNYNGSGLTLLATGLKTPSHLEIDRAAHYLYFTESGSGKIRRLALSSLTIKDLVVGQSNILGLAFDEKHNKLFWTENNETTGTVKMSNLDGTGITTLVSSLHLPFSIAVDPNTQTAFWATLPSATSEFSSDAEQQVAMNAAIKGTVEKINYDGTKRTKLWEGRIDITPAFPGNTYSPPVPGKLNLESATLLKVSPDGKGVVWRSAIGYAQGSSYSFDGSSVKLGTLALPGKDVAYVLPQNGRCGNAISFLDNANNEYTVWRPFFDYTGLMHGGSLMYGQWLIKQQTEVSSPWTSYPWYLGAWGLPGDIPMTMDYDGDAVLDKTVWRPSDGTWYILMSSYGGESASQAIVQYGLPGDYPVRADWDNDGKDDPTVFRPDYGLWFSLLSSNGAQPIVQWGLPGDYPLVGDYDGDSKQDKAVWRPSTGTWYVLLTSKGSSTNAGDWIFKQWGLPEDHPIAGDFDGDLINDLVVWRPSTGMWYVCGSRNKFDCTTGIATQWGLPGDIPVKLELDNDGKQDFAVWRPRLGSIVGTWYVLKSSDSKVVVQQWGWENDIPLGLDIRSMIDILY